EAVCDLDELRELRHSGRNRDAIARQAAGPALAVPLLVRGPDRLLHAGRQAEPLGQRPRHGRMPGNHPVEIAPAGDGELEPHPEAVQRRVAAADATQHRGRRPHAPKVPVELGRLERNVVAEPLRLLVRVGVTADADQQRGVVDGRALLLVEPDAVGEPQRDHALSQDVLHRLSEAEIDAERQRRNQLREPDLRHDSTMDYSVWPSCYSELNGSVFSTRRPCLHRPRRPHSPRRPRTARLGQRHDQRAGRALWDVADRDEEARPAARGRGARHDGEGRSRQTLHARPVRGRGRQHVVTTAGPVCPDSRTHERRLMARKFTAEEKAAAKAALKDAEGEKAVLEAIAKMAAADGAIAKRIHAIVRKAAPELVPRTWYGM